LMSPVLRILPFIAPGEPELGLELSLSTNFTEVFL
jgi:hypothetical protein